VVGKWVRIADKRPSLVIDGTTKWLGPMWWQIDENLILRYTPAKTRFTSGATVTLDLSMMPMVVEEMAKVPQEARHGPLIVNPRIGFHTAIGISARCGVGCGRSLASVRRSGTAICVRLVLLRRGRAQRRPTMLPRRLAIPSAPRRGSMTALGFRPLGVLLRPASLTAARTQTGNGVCRNVSRQKAKTTA
jgi:hypothetical protein